MLDTSRDFSTPEVCKEETKFFFTCLQKALAYANAADAHMGDRIYHKKRLTPKEGENHFTQMDAKLEEAHKLLNDAKSSLDLLRHRRHGVRLKDRVLSGEQSAIFFPKWEPDWNNGIPTPTHLVSYKRDTEEIQFFTLAEISKKVEEECRSESIMEKSDKMRAFFRNHCFYDVSCIGRDYAKFAISIQGNMLLATLINPNGEQP